VSRIICLITAILFTAALSGCSAETPGANVADAPQQESESTTTRDFTFESAGNTLSGIIDIPPNGEAEALVIFIHGYGESDVRGWNMYAGLRERFTALGVTTVTWDKPGMGQSGGTFDINQPVASSATEVLDAATWLRDNDIPGADRIGLWGLSRGGWIAPIALSQDPAMEFWISVSGTTAEDNYFYLLISNLPYEGYTAAEAATIEQEWKRGYEILRTGGTFETYQAATETLRANDYIREMMGEPMTREVFEAQQAAWLSGENTGALDEEAGMFIYVEDFDGMLANLDIDVLALFGEKDLNIDWQKTKALYEETIGQNPDATLRMESFPDANHNIDVAENGSISEMQGEWRGKAEGYYDVQVDWLSEVALGE